MSAPIALLAWLLSAAPLVLRALDPAAATNGPLGAWALLPWVALAGLPRGARAPGGGLLALALALPPAALALRLDGADGRGATGLAAALCGAVLAGVLALAAARAAGSSPRARLVHGAAWLLLVALPPLFAAAATWAARDPGHGSRAWDLARRSSPLGWAHAAASGAASTPDAGLASVPWGALAVALVLLALSGRGSRVGGSA